MYSDWLSLTEEIQQDRLHDNVLRSFPSDVSREVVSSVIRPLKDLVLGKAYTSSPLATQEQVEWTVQVVGYGLTLPLSDHNLLQGCVEVYHDWVFALVFQKHTTPIPISKNPNYYAQIIFNHFCALFVPRENEPRLLEDHAFLCKKVLDIVQNLVAAKGLKMQRETWNSLFSFLLHVCHLLLGPPIQDPSLGSTLSDLLVHVLFTSWLKACQDIFPGPNLWKTLRDMCAQWRHHNCVITQWTRLMYSLTTRVILCLYGNKHLASQAPLPSQDPDYYQLLRDMPNDTVVQCWFRMLHTLKNPVDLLYPEIITRTPGFIETLSKTATAGPLVQLCVAALPNIFHQLMKGITAQVSLWLGHCLSSLSHRSPSIASSTGTSSSYLSPSVKRQHSSKSHFYVPSPLQQPRVSTQESLYVNISPKKQGGGGDGSHGDQFGQSILEGIIGKPKGSTLLHIYGNWLFEAATWEGQDQEGFSSLHQGSHKGSTIITDTNKDGASIASLKQKVRDYEEGRAEAFEALCLIFSHLDCGEPVLKVYLARFYHALAVGLKYDPLLCSGLVLTRIISTSTTLLRKDLPGINVLVPQYLSALEKILSQETLDIQSNAQSEELRKSSIELLLSMLPLPLHYIHLQLPDITSLLQTLGHLTPVRRNSIQVTFYSLRNRFLALLFTALETETNDNNMAMLLHGLSVFMYDIVCYEKSLQTMAGEGVAGEGSDNIEDTEGLRRNSKEDFSLPFLFHQSIVAAHRALSGSPNSNTVTLAALELLSGLARLQYDALTHMDCRHAIHWICEFIETQSHQKPHLQTKSLHTSIVAAFTTLLVWITEHPHLLAHENCLGSILRVTEYGITGSFSKQEDGNILLKGDKQRRPISGRVGEIAEFALYYVMEKVGSFPSPCGAAANDSLLTEEEIIKRLPTTNRKSQPKFRYFIVDNSIILGLLDGSFTTDEDSLPTVTAIIRGPAGRQVWSLLLRQHPRSENSSQSHKRSEERPIPFKDPPSCPDLYRKPWPTEADIDREAFIPPLDTILPEQHQTLYHKIQQVTMKQIEVEDSKKLEQNRYYTEERPYPDPQVALEPPQCENNVDTVRLLLNHLDLLSIESLQAGVSPRQPPSLLAVELSSPNFRNVLSALDRMPTRYCNSVFIFYCRKGQCNMEEILATQQSLQSKPLEFIEFLNGLGWIVDPVKHPGFAGRLRPDTEDPSRHIGVHLQIPLRPFPYYADAITETAFILPVQRPSNSDSTSSVRSMDSSDSGQDMASFQADIPPSSFPAPQSVPTWSSVSGSGVQESTVHAEGVAGESVIRGRVLTSGESSDTPKRRTAIPQDCAVMVVWLECYNDLGQFPVEQFSKLLHKSSLRSNKVLPTIFIHKLSSGLYQIATMPDRSPGGPIINGMVVSRRSLSVLIRHTATNLCARHRMDNEGYPPPHVKRKRRIEEINVMHSKQMPVADFLTDMLLEH